MKKIIRLTEQDLVRLVKRVINEDELSKKEKNNILDLAKSDYDLAEQIAIGQGVTIKEICDEILLHKLTYPTFDSDDYLSEFIPYFDLRKLIQQNNKKSAMIFYDYRFSFKIVKVIPIKVNNKLFFKLYVSITKPDSIKFNHYYDEDDDENLKWENNPSLYINGDRVTFNEVFLKYKDKKHKFISDVDLIIRTILKESFDDLGIDFSLVLPFNNDYYNQ